MTDGTYCATFKRRRSLKEILKPPPIKKLLSASLAFIITVGVVVHDVSVFRDFYTDVRPGQHVGACR